MKELMTALIEAKVDPEKAEKALTSIENAISSRIEVAKMESYTEKIVPVEMETSGIRSEIRLLAEQMKLGFEKMDQKMDFVREGLEKRIDATEKMIIFTRENLEIQIRANQETNQQKFLALENHLRFHEKLLYTIIGLMVTLSIAVVVKILLV